MTTTTCWREHKNSFLGAVLGSERPTVLWGTAALTSGGLPPCLSNSPPMPAGPNHLRYPPRPSRVEEGDRGPVLRRPALSFGSRHV